MFAAEAARRASHMDVEYKMPTAAAGAAANRGTGPKGERQDGASRVDGAIMAGDLQLLPGQAEQSSDRTPPSSV